jgi:DNA polymerase-3 subunit gamma/tau
VALSDLTQELVGRRLSVVGVPEEQWHTIRAGFIKTNRDGESEHGDPGTEKEEDPVVSEAIKLFGSDLVEIKD